MSSGGLDSKTIMTLFSNFHPILLLLVKLDMTPMLEKVQGQSDSGENDDEII